MPQKKIRLSSMSMQRTTTSDPLLSKYDFTWLQRPQLKWAGPSVSELKGTSHGCRKLFVTLMLWQHGLRKALSVATGQTKKKLVRSSEVIYPLQAFTA
ncbi:hypothetical protein AVEN_159107-1 [Araneus ventricosus]|uniref:Uncharacterized protein n=1 Tax=Araneus ventricosus TaxID=182803 RepID=A0A4Y2B849_ARAVE|nr:hypothetical protein AVEN_159107-1 [Araneus ventricosus]